MGVIARDEKQRIARVQPQQKIIVSAHGREVVDFAQQGGKDPSIVISYRDQRGISAAQLFSRPRQSIAPEQRRRGIPKRRRELQPSRIAANHGLLERGLVPQTHNANNVAVATGDAQVFQPQTEIGELAKLSRSPDRKELVANTADAQESRNFFSPIRASRRNRDRT